MLDRALEVAAGELADARAPLEHVLECRPVDIDLREGVLEVLSEIREAALTLSRLHGQVLEVRLQAERSTRLP